MRSPHAHDPVLERSIQNRHAGFLLLAVVQTTLILAISVVAIGLPAMQRDLGLLPGELALVSAGYGVSFSALLLLGGRLADVVAPRRLLRIGLSVFGVASIGVAASPTFEIALVSRFGQGAGAAAAAPAAMALLPVLYPAPGDHATAVARWGALAPIGATAGVIVSGIAVAAGSWRTGLLLPAAVAAVGVPASRVVLPDAAASTAEDVDVAGAVLAVTGLGALAAGLVGAGDHGWRSPVPLGLLTVGIVGMAAFVRVEAAVRSPLVALSFLRPLRSLALVAVMAVAAGHAAAGFFLALYFQQVRGMGPLATTAAFSPLLVVLPLAGASVARLVARLEPVGLAAVGMAIAAVGLAALGTISTESPYFGTVFVGMAILPLGVGATFTVATVMAVRGAGRSRAGMAAGLLNTAIEIGPALGLAAFVSIANTRAGRLIDEGAPPIAATTAGYRLSFTVAAAALGLLAVAAALVRTRHRTAPCEGEKSPCTHTHQEEMNQ